MNCFNSKKVLVTGHTGFKGSWLSAWLKHLGAEVFGISSDLPSNPCNFEISHLSKVVEDHRIDVRDAEAVREVIHRIQPDFVNKIIVKNDCRLKRNNKGNNKQGEKHT